MTTNNISKIQFLLPIILYCVVAIAPLRGVGQNLVNNPGFSSGSAGWATGCSIEVNPETAYGGSDAANLTTEIDVERCFNQDICILPGVTYNFSFKASRRTQAQTVAAPGISFSVTGLSTTTKYVNVSKTYSNTIFNLQTETYSFTIPAGATDRKVNIAFADYNNTGTYGVILDDIQLAPVSGSTLSVNGADILSPGEESDWSVNNATASIAAYNWNFGAAANQPVSAQRMPSGVQWALIGTSNITVALSNGSCTVATLSKTIYIINQLLAVQFISFTGAVKENRNQLAWSTQHEENNKFFIVERSANGTSFDSIGLVLPAADGTVNNYSFTDAGFNTGNNYYRLRQVNKDGSYRNSATIIINNNAAVKMAPQLYPNPAASSIHLQLNSNTSTTVSIQVVNTSGVVMINKKQALLVGNNQYTVDVSSLETGVYFMQMTSDNGGIHFVQQFSKLK